MRIETERLILRQPEVQDADAYLQICNSEFVLRYNAMTPKTAESAEKYLTCCKEEILLLTLKKTGQVIGEVCIQEDSLRYGVTSKELSYWIGETYSRRGYMKEALRAVITYLFETEKLECVAARAFAPNTASLALLKSLGFQQNGYIPRCVKGYGNQIFDDTLHSLFCKDFQ